MMKHQTTRHAGATIAARYRAHLGLLLMLCMAMFWPSMAFSAAPTATVIVTNTALNIGGSSQVTITFSEAVVGFTHDDLDAANGTLSNLSYDGVSAYTATFTPGTGVTDPTNVISVDLTGVMDTFGTPGTGTADSNNFSIDTVRPTASIVVADHMIAIGETPLVTITFSEQVRDFTNADLTTGNGTLSPVSSTDGGITFTATLTPVMGATQSANVITLTNTGVTDASGNAGTASTNSNTYTVDTLRPIVAITLADPDLIAGETSLVTFTFSEAVTDFTNADFTIANATMTTITTWDGGLNWTATLTPTDNIRSGSNVITLDRIGVRDLAGNTGFGTTTSGNYAIDTIRPNASIVVADAELGAGETSVVTITFSVAVTGFTTADMTVANGTLSSLTSLDGGVTWTATLTPVAGITATPNRIELDNAGVQAPSSGNIGSGTTFSNSYSIDTAPPTATIVVAKTSLTPGEVTTVAITFSEAVTGFSLGDLTAPNGTLSNLTTSNGIDWTVTFTAALGVSAANNVITLNAAGLTDGAGNSGSEPLISNAYSIDAAPLTATIYVTSNTLGLGDTTLVTFTFSEAVTGFDNADLSVASANLSSVTTSDGGITWTATLTPHTNTYDTTNVIALNMAGVSKVSGGAGSGTESSNNYTVITTTISFSPTLGNATVGAPYSQTLTGGGGIGPYTFVITAGSLPNGISLNNTAGVISGTPTVGGQFSLTIRTTDNFGATGETAYVLTVNGAASVAASQRIAVEAGQLATVDLTVGGTGGPFIAATLVSVSPSGAGSAAITGTQLSFTPDIDFEGEAKVFFKLTNAYVTSPQATIFFDVTSRPTPSDDAEVTGLLTAQAESARRFAGSQMRNFHARLEQLHNEGDRRQNSMGVRLGYSGSASETSDADQPFAELLGQTPATDAGFAMHNYADGQKSRQPAPSGADVDLGRLAVWSGGYVNFGERDDGKLSLDYTTVGVSGGMDYRFSKSLVAGFGLGYGKDATDIGQNGSESRANAYSGAVYASYQPFKSTYLDALVGASWMDLSTRRYDTAGDGFVTGDRSGSQIFGSLTASYEKRNDAWLISPYGRVDFSRSWLDGYAESGDSAYLLNYGDQTLDTLSASVGLRLEYTLTTAWGTLKPGARAEYAHDVEGSSVVRLGYADTGRLDDGFTTDGATSDNVALGASLDAAFANDWNARLDYRTSVGGVGQSHALGLKVGKSF